MHARIDQLLSARDGEPLDAAIAAHVSACAHCTDGLVRLRRQRDLLKALPQLQAPDVWDAISRPAPLRRAQSTSRWAAVAAAVAFVSVVTVGYSLRDEPVRIPVAELSTTSPSQVTEDQLASLIAQSHTLETTLQQLPARRRVERAGTAATIDGLEERIQWLDYYLSYASDGLDETQASRLWEERVQLMDTLVKVRYANTVAM